MRSIPLKEGWNIGMMECWVNGLTIGSLECWNNGVLGFVS